MKVIAVVQARIGSKRLPGKALLKLANVPMIVHVLERAKAVRGLDEVILATSSNDRDTPLVELAASLGYGTWRGNEHDVLGRYADVAANRSADLVMRLTGDCPLLAPEVCEQVLAVALAERGWSCVTADTTVSGWPDGMDCEVMTVEALKLANERSFRGDEREHVTKWMRACLPTRIVRRGVVDRFSTVKLSVDCDADYQFVAAVVKRLPTGDFSLAATQAAVEQVLDV